MSARLLHQEDAAEYVGIRSTTDFYRQLKNDPTFPRALRRPLLGEDGKQLRNAKNEPRWRQPVWDRVDLDAWIEAQKEGDRRVAAEVDRLMSAAGRVKAQKRWAAKRRIA